LYDIVNIAYIILYQLYRIIYIKSRGDLKKMISYTPLWETMKRKNATSYTLQYKGQPYSVSSSTIRRLKAGLSVSTNTLDAICSILDCTIPDIIEYIPDEKIKNIQKTY